MLVGEIPSKEQRRKKRRKEVRYPDFDMLDNPTEPYRRPQVTKKIFYIDKEQLAGDVNGKRASIQRIIVPLGNSDLLPENIPENHTTIDFVDYLGGFGCLERALALAKNEQVWNKLGRFLPDQRVDRHGKQRIVVLIVIKKLHAPIAY